MEYFLLSCGAIYYLKRKKYISFNSIRNIAIVNDVRKYVNAIKIRDEKHIELLKKMNTKEYLDNKQLYDEINNRRYNVISFKSVGDISKLKMITDSDLYGGDTVAEFDYNIEKDAMIIKGHFEMKNKNLIEYDKMFARVHCKKLLNYRYYDYVNLIRVCMKTNGHIIKITLEEDVYKVDLSFYKAYIVDKSNEFRTYEIPLKNLKLSNQDALGGTHILNNFKLEDLYVEIESKTEGPFEVEIKSIEFIYDYRIEEFYRKHKEPLFKRIPV